MLTEEQADDILDLIDEGELDAVFAKLRSYKVSGAALLEDEYLATGLANRLVSRLQTLVSRATRFDGQQPLDTRLRNECNREVYLDEFDEAYEVCGDKPAQSFVIHGASHHVPKVLFERVYREFYLDEECQATAEVVQVPGVSHRRLRKKVFKELFKKFGTEPMREKHSVEAFLNLPRIRNQEFVLINFEIESRFWDKAVKFIEEFTQEFLQPLGERDEPARFVFFWSVIYEQEKVAARKAKIIGSLEKLQPDKVLSELETISPEDLKTWIASIENQTSMEAAKLYNLVEDEFRISQKESFTMREALRYFDFIAESYKNL